MSDMLLHWTDLPQEIKPDFVSHVGDYDFPFYLSEKEEYVNFKNTKHKGKITICEPFLIMELNRFVPYLGNNCIKFHSLNMPNIRIGKIEIVGFVVSINEDARCYQYQIDDGTGSITIFYKKEHFEAQRQERQAIDQKYRIHARNLDIKLLQNQTCPKRFPDPRPKFDYPNNTSIRDMAIHEHNWSLETRNGLLGKTVKRCDYVHAVGYCALDFLFHEKPQEEITFKDLSIAKLNFFATKVICIDEWDYNAKLYSWLNTVVRRRYDEHPDKPEFLPKHRDIPPFKK